MPPVCIYMQQHVGIATLPKRSVAISASKLFVFALLRNNIFIASYSVNIGVDR